MRADTFSDMAPTAARSELPEPWRVYLADDDPNARTLLSIALSECGMDLSFFEDGASVMEAIHAELPDIAILDVQMPGFSGIEVCREIKAQEAEAFVPVILLTSQAELTDKVNGLNCGADDYITKPFNVAELDARIKALLRIKSLTDQLQQTQDLLAVRERELIAMHVAGAAAHELGQPLTTMMLSFRLLSQAEPASEKFGSILRTLQEQCGRMKAILTKLNEVQHYRTREYAEQTQILDL